MRRRWRFRQQVGQLLILFEELKQGKCLRDQSGVPGSLLNGPYNDCQSAFGGINEATKAFGNHKSRY